MGEAAAVAIDELQVTRLSSSVVLPPPSDGPREPFFLPNIDQVLNFPVETVHFFAANPDYRHVGAVLERLHHALREMLAQYEFLGGRLRVASDGRLEIDCNGKGAVLVAAESGAELRDLGDLARPNPALRQLVTTKRDATGGEDADDSPMCFMQVTWFKCGSFALGVCVNHITFDGISFAAFLRNVAAVAGGKPLAVVPCNDRRLLAARSPPHVDFPHPELFNIAAGSILDKPPSSSATAATELQCKLFTITEKDISFLKYKAISGSASPSEVKVSSFCVVTTHLWRSKALAIDASERRSDTSVVLYAVDLRPRLDPPLPKSYAGNAVLSAYASASYEELASDASFSRLVEAVRGGCDRIDDSYARSVIDWGELNKGFPIGDVFVSSWWRLGFADVEYPWGKPVYSGPVADASKDIVLLFPPGPGESGAAAGDGGVVAQVALPAGEMERFEKLFYKFLER